MCVFGGGGGPSVPQESEEAKQQRLAKEAEEKQKKEQAKAKALEETVKTYKKGIARPSLLTGTKGGIGYYSETL
jgi:hypothetical protein